MKLPKSILELSDESFNLTEADINAIESRILKSMIIHDLCDDVDGYKALLYSLKKFNDSVLIIDIE